MNLKQVLKITLLIVILAEEIKSVKRNHNKTSDEDLSTKLRQQQYFLASFL